MARIYNVTVADIIGRVRILIQDLTTSYRTTDSEIIEWLNDALRSLVTLMPGLFVQQAVHSCTAGSRQTFDAELAHSLVDIVGVPRADYASMTAFNPQWQNAAQGEIQNWLQAVNESLNFFTYPPQAAATQLQVLYVKAPVPLSASTDSVPLPETYAPALVAYCVAMVEAKDDESVDSNRSAQQMADFVGRIKGGA